MTLELIERTARDWVSVDPARGARELERLADVNRVPCAKSAEDIVEALIQLAGRKHIAERRAW
jgi:hypothetical protein